MWRSRSLRRAVPFARCLHRQAATWNPASASPECIDLTLEDTGFLQDGADFPEDGSGIFALNASDYAELAATSSDVPSFRRSVPISQPSVFRNSNAIGEPEYPPTSPIALKILREKWGFPGFRLQQAAVISRLIHGGSAAVIFPTGGGKSLIYQVPALAFDLHDEDRGSYAQRGVTLVVSPLIALMKDQVMSLKARGIKAASLDSSQDRDSVLNTYNLLRKAELKLLYLAPERLNNEGFVETIRHVRVRMVAVDEAHCISEWGQSFRPEYLKVARFVKEIGVESVLCLTATATPRVVSDICAAFDIPNKGLFKSTTYRPNLQILAESVQHNREKMPILQKFLTENPGSTIVYVSFQKQSEDLARKLRAAGFNANAYHAGMWTEDKTSVQEKFMVSKNTIIVATIAFGMGIDKANIRNIVHYDLPRSVEGYSQEIGRSGRDGLHSKCLFFLCPEDIHVHESFSLGDLPSKRGVKGLLDEFFSTNKGAKSGDIVEASLHDQSIDWDIKTPTLKILFAQLELRFNLFRAMTPKYTRHVYTCGRNFCSKTSSDASSVAKAILNHSYRERTRIKIDVDHVSLAAEIPREEIVRKLQDWNNNDYIELTPSGVVNRYRILQKLPSTRDEIDELIDKVYEQMEAREADDLARTKQVIDFITSPSCLTRRLAAHFEDQDSVSKDGCGQCQFCMTKKQTVIKHSEKSRKNKVDKKKIEKVLEACRERDDSRLLARVAFGISSPRIAVLGYGRGNRVFGSMINCEFKDLLKVFEKHCTDNGPPQKTKRVKKASKTRTALTRKALVEEAEQIASAPKTRAPRSRKVLSVEEEEPTTTTTKTRKTRAKKDSDEGEEDSSPPKRRTVRNKKVIGEKEEEPTSVPKKRTARTRKELGG